MLKFSFQTAGVQSACLFIDKLKSSGIESCKYLLYRHIVKNNANNTQVKQQY